MVRMRPTIIPMAGLIFAALTALLFGPLAGCSGEAAERGAATVERQPVSGSVDYRHTFVNMNDVPVNLNETYPYNVAGVSFPDIPPASPGTCRGSIGSELLAGTR